MLEGFENEIRVEVKGDTPYSERIISFVYAQRQKGNPTSVTLPDVTAERERENEIA